MSVARALYSGGSLLLLDDVLSALDAHVQRQLVNNLVRDCDKNKKLVIFGEKEERWERLSFADCVFCVQPIIICNSANCLIKSLCWMKGAKCSEVKMLMLFSLFVFFSFHAGTFAELLNEKDKL